MELQIKSVYDTNEDMRGQKTKVTKVADIVDRIISLRKIIADASKELRELEGQPIQTTSPIPTDFDYKGAIMRLFHEKPNVVLNIDNIVAALTAKEGFVPSRSTIAIRVGYLADSANPIQLERVPEKRGYYRLPTKATEKHDASSG